MYIWSPNCRLKKGPKGELYVVCILLACVHAQSNPTLCDPMDSHPSGSSAHEISRQEYWNGLPFLTPRDLPEAEIKFASPESPALAGRFFTTKPPGKLCVFCVCGVKSSSVVSYSLQPHGVQPTRLLCPWNSPGQNTRVGSCSLLRGIFPTQGSNPGLPHCRQIFYHPSHLYHSLKRKLRNERI